MRALIVRFQKFFLSGASAAILNFAIFYLLFNLLSINYIISAVVAFLLAFIFAFIMHRYWSFSDFKNVALDKQLTLYFLLSIGNLILTIVLLYLLVNFLFFPVFISYVIAAGSTTVLSFVVNNFIIFNKTKFDDSLVWKICIVIFCIASILLALRYSLYPFEVSTDTQTFIDTTKYYLGETEVSPGFRLLKPLPQLALASMHKLQNIDYLFSFKILNSATYLLLALVSIIFFYIFFRRNKYATYSGAILTISAYPVFRYGLDPMVEVGALIFVFLSAISIILYNRYEKKFYLLGSLFFILVGFLWKEYTALMGFSFFFLVVCKFYKNQKKYFVDLALTIIIPLVFLLGWNLICYYLYAYTYLDWFSVGQSGDGAFSQFTPYFIAKSFFATLLIGWVYVLLGILNLKKIDVEQKRELVVFLLSLPLVFAWGYVSSRLYFPGVISFLCLGALGILYIKDRFGKNAYILALVVYIFVCTSWALIANSLKVILGN